MQENPYQNEQPPQAISSTSLEHAHFVEKPKPTTPVENAIIQAAPDEEQTPLWLRETTKRIADAWFDPKSFESPEAYERLGVKTIKRYMPTGGDIVTRLVRKMVGGGGWVRGNLESLKDMEHFTRLYEGAHIAAFALLSANIGLELASGDTKTAAAVTALNIATNVFPIMLQRYNRLRLYRAIHRMEEKQNLPRL